MVIIIKRPQLVLLTNVCVFHNCGSTHASEYAPTLPSCTVGPACTPQVVGVLLFLTEFSEHIWSEDKRGWRDGAKRRRGEWGANGEGCEQAEDEDLRPSIITVPHEECQLLQSRADPTFADLWPLGPKLRRLLEPSGYLISRRASTPYYFNYQLVQLLPMQDRHPSCSNALKQHTFMFKWRFYGHVNYDS